MLSKLVLDENCICVSKTSYFLKQSKKKTIKGRYLEKLGEIETGMSVHRRRGGN
jgi:hypothetical protein